MFSNETKIDVGTAPEANSECVIIRTFKVKKNKNWRTQHKGSFEYARRNEQEEIWWA